MTQLKKIEGFTPGPWAIKEQLNGIYWIDKAGGKNFGTIGTVLDCDSNASLIAYAPTLYSIALEQQKEIIRLKGLLETQYINWWRDNGTERLSESLQQFKTDNQL